MLYSCFKKMKLIILLALMSFCLVGALQDKEVMQEWLNFNKKYGKKYRSIEENNNSFRNFKDNFEKIIQHNKRFEQNLETYKMAINPFTDMSLKQMENSYMGLKISEQDKQRFHTPPQFRASAKKSCSFPTFMDWRVSGAITPVKNQMDCGSCWAFASTGSLEAHRFLKDNKTVLMSEQNLIDCVDENYGCEGGWITPCFDYVRTNGGINPESIYPYEAVNGQCRYKSNYVATTCSGYQLIRQDDEQHMLEIVATKGPVAVAIDANLNFMSYVQGIYDDPKCAKAVNHAVLVVGYGTENGQDYWLVKNSWGTDWGDKGYIKMARNKHNQCAIASYAIYPLV